MAENVEKIYIGDGVYAEFDGWNVILTTENGISVTNTIVLEPQVITSLEDFIVSIRRMQAIAIKRAEEEAAKL